MSLTTYVKDSDLRGCSVFMHIYHHNSAKKNRTNLGHNALFSSWKALSNESSLDPTCNL